MINLNEERILDFLDGRLATPDEEELLHTLAVSPERRQVLRAHIRLRELTSNLARQDRFTVPESVTDNLFSRLEEAGFNPPQVPQSMTIPGTLGSEPFAIPVAGAAGAGVLATAVSSGWRFGMMGLITASVMSFVLGAGAYYVFGSSLGLHTRSQELAALRHASPHAVAQAHHAASASVMLADNSSGAENISLKSISHITPDKPQEISSNSQPIGPMAPMSTIAANNAENSGTQNVAQSDNSEPISVTAPKEVSYGLAKDKMEYLNGPPTIWENAVPTPYSLDRGTMSVRAGIGPGYSSTNGLSNMTEFRIGWTMWNYVLWRASMGQMTSYEREAAVTLNNKGIPEITTNSTTPVSTTLVGLEGGVTLDPLGVPIDALMGFMYSGGSGGANSNYSPFYGRASLMAHFEPWKLLEVSAGIEGIFYTHYLDGTNGSITREESVSRLPGSAVSSSAVRSETCGLVGPAIEIGWHF